ncbi:MAG: hypothetical protein HY289_10785 [Planctomycetes bacterium]|nr:hypothetical protein [Planctomycetota bacterium]
MSGPDYYDDDFDRPQTRAGSGATSAGAIGFIFAVVSIGLIAVVALLWYFLNEEQAQNARNVDQKRWMLYWFVLLDILSFLAALTAALLGGRGLSPSNPLYRGWSMAALILGLLEIVVTLIFGLFITCCVAAFEIFGGR